MARHFKGSATSASDRAAADRMPSPERSPYPRQTRPSSQQTPARDARPGTQRGARGVIAGHDDASPLWRLGLSLSGMTYALGVALCLMGALGLLHRPVTGGTSADPSATPVATSTQGTTSGGAASAAGTANTSDVTTAWDSATTTSVPGAQPVGKTFSLGGWRFDVPAYWVGRVDVLYGYCDGDNVYASAQAYDWANFYAAGTDYAIARVGYASDWSSVNPSSSYNPTRWSSPADWATHDGFLGGREDGSANDIVLDSDEAFCVFVPSHYFSDSRSRAGGYNKFAEGGFDGDDVYDLVDDLQRCGGEYQDLSGSAVRGASGTFVHAIMASAVREGGEVPAPQEAAESEQDVTEPVADAQPSNEDAPVTADDTQDDSLDRGGISSRTSEFYGVWADSAQDHDYCVRALEKARQEGFDAELFVTDDWEDLSQKTRGWYVVTLVCAADKDEADAVLERAREAGYDNAYVKWTGSYVGP